MNLSDRNLVRHHPLTSEGQQHCECCYPIRVLSADVVTCPSHPLDPSVMIVDRYCDCLIHGVTVQSMHTLRDRVYQKGERIDYWRRT